MAHNDGILKRILIVYFNSYWQNKSGKFDNQCTTLLSVIPCNLNDSLTCIRCCLKRHLFPSLTLNYCVLSLLFSLTTQLINMLEF